MLFSAMNGAQMGALYGFEAFQIVAYLQAALGVLDLTIHVGGILLRRVERCSVGDGLFAIRGLVAYGVRLAVGSATPWRTHYFPSLET